MPSPIASLPVPVSITGLETTVESLQKSGGRIIDVTASYKDQYPADWTGNRMALSELERGAVANPLFDNAPLPEVRAKIASYARDVRLANIATIENRIARLGLSGEDLLLIGAVSSESEFSTQLALRASLAGLQILGTQFADLVDSVSLSQPRPIDEMDNSMGFMEKFGIDFDLPFHLFYFDRLPLDWEEAPTANASASANAQDRKNAIQTIMKRRMKKLGIPRKQLYFSRLRFGQSPDNAIMVSATVDGLKTLQLHFSDLIQRIMPV